jgi:hypothetical protein
MLTTTTSSRCASWVPWYQGTELDPVWKPPPWIHTSTGRWPSSAVGVATFRNRQSSDWSKRPAPSMASRPPTPCGAMAPKRLPSRTPDHGSTGWGGLKRSGPTGGAANGMPRNIHTPSRSMPLTSPDFVCAITGPT